MHIHFQSFKSMPSVITPDWSLIWSLLSFSYLWLLSLVFLRRYINKSYSSLILSFPKQISQLIPPSNLRNSGSDSEPSSDILVATERDVTWSLRGWDAMYVLLIYSSVDLLHVCQLLWTDRQLSNLKRQVKSWCGAGWTVLIFPFSLSFRDMPLLQYHLPDVLANWPYPRKLSA